MCMQKQAETQFCFTFFTRYWNYRISFKMQGLMLVEDFIMLQDKTGPVFEPSN